MGTLTDVIVFGVASADTVTSLEQGFDPAGYAGSVISLAASGGQAAVSLGEYIGVTAPSIKTVTSITKALSGVGAVGSGLTAVQVIMDINEGKDIKVGDTL